MVFWRTAPPAQPTTSTAASAGTDPSDEVPAEVDEPPNELRSTASWVPQKLHSDYIKNAQHPGYQRRESLLTRQLHSETEHSDDESHSQPRRALSTQSTWSSQSTTSAAELTSDDGRSMASPAISPPLAPTHIRNGLPILEKPLDKKLEIVGQEDASVSDAKEGAPEKSVEATLGRKRCIMFACGGKDKAKPPPAPPSKEPEKPAVATSPLKRKCMIKFACPTKSATAQKANEKAQAKRPVSPPPNEHRPSVHHKPSHRGSDSTVTHISPKSIRRNPGSTTTVQIPIPTETVKPVPTRKLSNDSDDNATEALRFHEFASSDDEPEEWCQESTCHRSRLTVDDTLKKELVIRKACEEVEEEAIEEDEEVEGDEAADVDDEQDEDQEDEEDESEGSDAGFHSDDEQGFAASDSEGENSDYEWWKPGGSTAATSIEHLDRLNIQTKQSDGILGTSIGSASSGHLSPRSSRHNFHHQSPRRKRPSVPIPIVHQQQDDDLPDSTDFVCGTLDEDRPIEQAYINRKKEVEAAKHKLRPQDIDPSFPTSDPEMDEEDDEDLEDPEESEEDDLVHGGMEELHGRNTRRRPSPPPKRTSTAHRSPPPPTRHHSPPPPTKRRVQYPSPPPLSRRGTARSPPPRKLFGHSPQRANSPAPSNRMTSPPNTRRSSPTGRGAMPIATPLGGLAERPRLTHTASLPRGGFLISKLGSVRGREHSLDGSVPVTGVGNTDIPKRGAIDIVKGLEKKRQRRKEKMYQKMCAKNAAKGEKTYKVKPGKGAERMREVGLELQRYHGKGEHILSV